MSLYAVVQVHHQGAAFLSMVDIRITTLMPEMITQINSGLPSAREVGGEGSNPKNTPKFKVGDGENWCLLYIRQNY